MSDTERLTLVSVLTALLYFIPAFVSARFAGSVAGFALGAAAATSMLSLLIYPLTKYTPSFRSGSTRVASMRELLTFHVYMPAFSALSSRSCIPGTNIRARLALSSSSAYSLSWLPDSSAAREERSRLATLRSVYDRTAPAVANWKSSEDVALPSNSPLQSAPILKLVDGMADLEYAIGCRAVMKRILVPRIVAHVVAAILMYALLSLHVAGEIYYGLRWLS